MDILINTKSGYLFNRLKTGSNFGDNKYLNKIETDYRDNKDLNQVETNYRNDKDAIEFETNYEDNKDNFEIKTNYSNNEESMFLEVVACHTPLLPHLRPANILDPSDETPNMAEFNMMQSSPPANPMAVGPSLLTSSIN